MGLGVVGDHQGAHLASHGQTGALVVVALDRVWGRLDLGMQEIVPALQDLRRDLQHRQTRFQIDLLTGQRLIVSQDRCAATHRLVVAIAHHQPQTEDAALAHQGRDDKLLQRHLGMLA